MVMAPRYPPENAVKPPPPPGPPCRAYKESFFSKGLIETKESKQKTHDYEVYMEGYRAGANSQTCHCPDVPVPQGPIGKHRDGDY